MVGGILEMGDPRLLPAARPIKDIGDPGLEAIIADMYETMMEPPMPQDRRE